jgi:hypothetical protein
VQYARHPSRLEALIPANQEDLACLVQFYILHGSASRPTLLASEEIEDNLHKPMFISIRIQTALESLVQHRPLSFTKVLETNNNYYWNV